MQTNPKITHQVNGLTIQQRNDDGYLNGTAMCVAHGKKIFDWLRTQETFDLVEALAEDLGIAPITKDGKIRNSRVTSVSAAYPQLVVSKRGSPENDGGTWLHPDLAIQLAQWCSPKFALQVSRWIREWMTSNTNPVYQKNPTRYTSIGRNLWRDDKTKQYYILHYNQFKEINDDDAALLEKQHQALTKGFEDTKAMLDRMLQQRLEAEKN